MIDFKTYTITPDEKQRIISVIKESLESHVEIVFAYVFGSFADEDALFFRDIDVGVYVKDDFFSKQHSLDYTISLSLEIEKLVKDFPVDVVTLNDAPLPIVFHATEGILLFLSDEAFWTDFVTKTWSLYHDHSISSRYVLEDLVSR